MRALLGSLLLGLAVRCWFTRVRVLPDGHEVFEVSSRSSRTWRTATCACSSAADCLLPEGALSPAQQWRMCGPSTRVSTPASKLYLAMSTTPTPWTMWAPSWRLTSPTASACCSSAGLSKGWLWLEPGSSLAHTSTSAAFGCPWMAVQSGLSVSAAGWRGVCMGRS
ncbi:hypothetical protein V8C86DRAFT_2759089 [Haematococcus lacustris]